MPLAGVLMPGTARLSSRSLSTVGCLPSFCSVGSEAGLWRLIAGGSCSNFFGDVIENLLLEGGGERSRGDTGHRGVSLSSDVTDNFWATCEWMEDGSNTAGCNLGIEAADSARCCAAAEGGFVFALADRDGLTSLALFFLERPGPADRAVTDLSEGRTGDDSLEGSGELFAEVARLACSLFVCESRREELDSGGPPLLGA